MVTRNLAEKLPAEVRDSASFVYWVSVPQEGGRKPRKVPYYASTRRPRAGKQNTPEDLARLAPLPAAVQAAIEERAAGIGYAPGKDGLATILDLDDCLIGGKVATEPAKSIVQACAEAGAYIEKSPSGNGLRVIVRYAGLGDFKTRGLEVFERVGFVTLTGRTAPGYECRGLVPLPARARELIELAMEMGNGPGGGSDVRPKRWGSVDEAEARSLRAVMGGPYNGLNGSAGAEALPAPIAALRGALAVLDPVDRSSWIWTATRVAALMRNGPPGLAHQAGSEFVRWAGEAPEADPPEQQWAKLDEFDAECDGMSLFTVAQEFGAAGAVAEGATHWLGFDILDDATAAAEERAEQGQRQQWFRSMRDLLAAEPPRWLVKRLLPRGAFVLVAGRPKTGKSFLVSDLGLAGARGLPEWFGLKIPAPFRVLYINAEGSMTQRLRAYVDHYGQEAVTDRFVVITRRLKLDAQGGAALRKAVAEYEAQHGAFDLIVVDTVARAMTGNENSPDDMGAFVDQCEALVAEGRRTVIAVHHFGKDEGRGSRGHTSLPAAVSTQINVEAGEDGTRRFHVELQRDEEALDARYFRLDRIVYAWDEDGDELSSVIVQPVAAPAVDDVEGPGQNEPRGRWQRLARQVFREAVDGIDPLPARTIGDRRVVEYRALWDRVRAAAVEGDPRGNGKRAFDRMLEEGEFLGFIKVDNETWVFDPSEVAGAE